MMGQLVPNGETALSTQRAAMPKVDASDILIPRLSLQQATSDLCKKGKARPGDILRSLDKAVVASGETTLEVIPLSYNKSWVVKRKKNPNDSRGEFVRIDAFKPGDEKMPLTWNEQAQVYWRDLNFNLYCLVADDVKRATDALKAFEETGELPDAGASCMPSVISFQRTSYPAGKVFATHFVQCLDVSEQVGRDVPPFGYVFELGRDFVEKENSWHVWTAKRGRKVTDEERTMAAKWVQRLAVSNVQVDNSEFEGEAETAEATYEDAPHPAGEATREF